MDYVLYTPQSLDEQQVKEEEEGKETNRVLRSECLHVSPAESHWCSGSTLWENTERPYEARHDHSVL